MPKYRALAQTTKAVEEKVDNGDFVVVSEKAISTATGRIVDESRVKPGLNAKIISNFWMRFVWGFFLGVLCRFGQRLILRLRRYPIEYGSRHKQGVWQHAVLFGVLMFGSEGVIDGSTLPYSYVRAPHSAKPPAYVG